MNYRDKLLYTPYISRGFYFHEFRESGAIREFINTRKYLPPIPTHECDLCTQYIALLDREFNHSRKCLKVPIREKLDSRNICRIQYTIEFIKYKSADVHYTINTGKNADLLRHTCVHTPVYKPTCIIYTHKISYCTIIHTAMHSRSHTQLHIHVHVHIKIIINLCISLFCIIGINKRDALSGALVSISASRSR